MDHTELLLCLFTSIPTAIHNGAVSPEINFICPVFCTNVSYSTTIEQLWWSCAFSQGLNVTGRAYAFDNDCSTQPTPLRTTSSPACWKIPHLMEPDGLLPRTMFTTALNLSLSSSLCNFLQCPLTSLMQQIHQSSHMQVTHR